MALIVAVLTGALALAGEGPSPAPAPAPQAAEDPPAPARDAPPNSKGGGNTTGRHKRARPICLKRSEWAERARDDRKLVGAIQAGSQVGNKTPGTQN